MVELLKEKYPNYNPVLALVEIAYTTKDKVLKYQAHKEIAKYICPQLKSIEVREQQEEVKIRVVRT